MYLSRYLLFLTFILNSDIPWEDKYVLKKVGYWDVKENQRNFMENLAKKFQIIQPQEWNKLTIKKVIEHGGCSLLKRYGLSLYRALQGIYPEVSWKREWFHIPRFPKTFWNSEVNQQEFLSEIAENYNLQSQTDWKRVSANFLRNKGGQVRVYSDINFVGTS